MSANLRFNCNIWHISPDWISFPVQLGCPKFYLNWIFILVNFWNTLAVSMLLIIRLYLGYSAFILAHNFLKISEGYWTPVHVHNTTPPSRHNCMIENGLIWIRQLNNIFKLTTFARKSSFLFLAHLEGLTGNNFIKFNKLLILRLRQKSRLLCFKKWQLIFNINESGLIMGPYRSAQSHVFRRWDQS